MASGPIQMVRAHAAEWKLDPKRIGVIRILRRLGIARATAPTPVAGDPECGGSDRPRQFAAGLHRAGV